MSSEAIPPVTTVDDSYARLEDFLGLLSAAPDVGRLREAILRGFRRFTGYPSAVLLELVAGGNCYLASCGLDAVNRDSLPHQIAARSALAKWLRVNETALVVRQAPDVVAYLPDVERTWLSELNAQVCIPLLSAHHLAAIVVVSHTETVPLSAGVRDLLASCGRQAALALDRAIRQQADRDEMAAAARVQQLATAGQMAAAMAHEVRNPLTTIRSSVQYLMNSDIQWTSQLELLQQVVDEVDRINRTISGVLGFSRPRALQTTSLEWLEVLERSLELLRPHLAHHRLRVERDFEPTVLPVEGDGDELGQVFLNLFLNACQAMPEGGRLLISVRQVMRDDQPLGIVTIADDGPGMAPATLAKIFDPFFTTKPSGTGLGLPICVQIMERHGGTLRIQSELGQGTTATLSLPLRPH